MILDVDSICKMMDSDLSGFIHNIILIIKVAVPIILVIFGMLDFAKGVIASKEDEIKKGQHNFIKRLIAGTTVFLMISITQLVINLVDKESGGQFWVCANAIMNGDGDKRDYYKEQHIMEESKIVYSYCCQKMNERHDKMYGTPGYVPKLFDGVNRCAYGSDSEMIYCAEQVSNALRNKYGDVYKDGCQYTYDEKNGSCVDRQYSITSTMLSQKALEKLFESTFASDYEQCCNETFGSYFKNNCFYDDASYGRVESCVISKNLIDINK